MAETQGRIGHLIAIDDSEFDQMSNARLIERSGLVDDYRYFLDAREALHYMHSQDRPGIDAILLDINMPVMDGFEFLDTATREFGEDFAGIVVLMLTTSLSPRDTERARTYPVVREYCNKPVTLALLERLAIHLRDAA